MANCIVTTSYTFTIGNGLDLPAWGDFACIGAGVMLGTALIGGRGIFATGDYASVQIAGSVLGNTETTFNCPLGSLTAALGSSILAHDRAVVFQQSGRITNSGTIAGSTGIETGANIEITNAGTISGAISTG